MRAALTAAHVMELYAFSSKQWEEAFPNMPHKQEIAALLVRWQEGAFTDVIERAIANLLTDSTIH